MTKRSRRQTDLGTEDWNGSYVRYDIVKEFTIALLLVALLGVLLAALLSSPDKQPVTIVSWARADPGDFLSTAVTELDGTSTTAQYGPPYNSTPGAGQSIGPLSLQRVAGVHQPIDTAVDFVLGPLRSVPNSPAVQEAVRRYLSAGFSQQGRWTSNYSNALSHATFSGGTVQLRRGNYGPVPAMMGPLLALGRSGGLDGYLVSTPQFYSTNYTKPLVFLADGSYLKNLAATEHLQGSQWGMMNETGSFPGQAWLWLYTMWYQIPPLSKSGNADAFIWGIMAILTLALILVPFIPGLRDLPRHLRLYRLIWRDHYKRLEEVSR